jgi:hypothetical protein
MAGCRIPFARASILGKRCFITRVGTLCGRWWADPQMHLVHGPARSSEEWDNALIIAPITALYPLVVILLVPFVLCESINSLHVMRIICALIAVEPLSIESENESFGTRISSAICEPHIAAGRWLGSWTWVVTGRFSK